VLGGIVYVLVAKLLHWLQIDDPVDAIPIHGGCGTLGAIVIGFLNRDTGLVYGFGAHQLGIQFLGIVCFAAWYTINHMYEVIHFPFHHAAFIEVGWVVTR
jgi:Amt family ammonium transporter